MFINLLTASLSPSAFQPLPKKHALLFERKVKLAGEPTIEAALESPLSDVAQ